MNVEDNDSYYKFKLKSLILLIPELVSNMSPIIFIESEEDNVKQEHLDFVIDSDNIKTLEYFINKETNEHIFNPNEINKIYSDESFELEEFYHHFHFLTKGLFCFLNIQGLDYNRNYNRFIRTNREISGKQFEVEFRKYMKK